MEMKTPPVLAAVVASLVIAPAAFAQENSANDEAPVASAETNTEVAVSGTVSCDLATGYVLQKVNVVVRDQAQAQCAANFTLNTELGVFGANAWNTTDVDGDFSAETDLGATYRPSSDSPWAFQYSHFFIDGDDNDINKYGVTYNFGEAGSLSAEVLDRETGETGFVVGYNAPQFQNELLGGNLNHGPTISYARRPGSGDELVSVRYNAQWTRPVSDNVDFVVRGQASQPIHTTGAVDDEPVGQINVGLRRRF